MFWSTRRRSGQSASVEEPRWRRRLRLLPATPRIHNSVVVASGKRTSGANEKQRNNQLVSLVKAQDWKGIIDLYWREKESFIIINVSTMFDQLKNIKELDPDEESVAAFFEDTNTLILATSGHLSIPKRLHRIRRAIESMNATHHFSGGLLVQHLSAAASMGQTSVRDNEKAHGISNKLTFELKTWELKGSGIRY